MNQEDFVTLETAVLLKLKGFNWPCEHRYRKAVAEIKSGEVGLPTNGFICLLILKRGDVCSFPAMNIFLLRKLFRQEF